MITEAPPQRKSCTGARAYHWVVMDSWTPSRLATPTEWEVRYAVEANPIGVRPTIRVRPPDEPGRLVPHRHLGAHLRRSAAHRLHAYTGSRGACYLERKS
jgi:hypothetical protein